MAVSSILKKAKPVKTIKELKKYASKDGGESFFVLLNFGVRSSKHISYDKQNKKFHIENEIDGSRRTIGEKRFSAFPENFIFHSMKSGCFFKYCF